MSAAAGLVALQAAIIAALKAAGGVTSLLDSANAVYDGVAPNPTSGAQPSKYLVVRSPTFIQTGVFNSIGADNGLEIHVWHPSRKDAPVLAIVAAIGDALDGVKLSLAGGAIRHWTGETQLIGILDDTQATPPLKHGIVAYLGRTQ